MSEPSAESVEALRQEREELRTALDQRFEELALLTRELEAQREEAEAWRRRAEAAEQALASGGAEGEVPAAEERALVEASGWFDAEWYRQQNPDVAEHPSYADDPLTHFLLHGAAEGRWPCEHFDPGAYARAYADVPESGLNPLVHFLRIGQYEQRDPAPES